MSIMDDVNKNMKASIDHFLSELKSIRTGRANPGMLDHVMVEVYGTEMRLRDIASITTPEPRSLLITPFDRSNTESIGKSITKSNIGYQPIVDANVVRINIPPMDQQQRKGMAKEIHKKLEDTKVSIRHVRRDGIDAARKQKDGNLISEDEEKRLEKLIQEKTDHFCSEAEKLAADKEKEVMTV